MSTFKKILLGSIVAGVLAGNVSAHGQYTVSVGFDPTAHAEQVRLSQAYTTGLPFDLKAELDAFFGCNEVRALLGGVQGMIHDTGYWNTKYPNYFCAYQKRVDETDEQWRVRLAGIDAKNKAFAQLWRPKKGCFYKLLEKAVKKHKGIKLIGIVDGHVKLVCRAGLVDYVVFLRCFDWYHSRFQLTSMLFYYDQWKRHKMSERFAIDMPQMWAYQHTFKNEGACVDDTTCAIVIADDATVSQTKKNVQAIQSIIEKNPEKRTEIEQLITELGVWSVQLKAPRINSDRFILQYEQLPHSGGARHEYVFHTSPSELASNAKIGRDRLEQLLKKKFGLSVGGQIGLSIVGVAALAGVVAGGYLYLKNGNQSAE